MGSYQNYHSTMSTEKELTKNIELDSMQLPEKSQMSSVFEYRPHIDGLRAIAIISVLIFHFDKHLLQGGFIGVDVFFVISGYLITSIIISDCENGKFSFAHFYQRRISRIFPVFFLVSIFTLTTAYFLYTPQDFASTGAVAISAVLSVANLKFMLQGNYFQISPDAQPLLHFWSLSVEEQFYLIFPLIIYLAFQIGITRRNLFYVLIAITVFSFAACVALTTKNSTWAFYLLPTRAWELLSGCILATYRPHSRTGNQRFGQILSNIGLLAIISSFFVIKEIAQEMQVRTNVISVAAGDPFPGTQLYKDSLLFLDRANPDITIFAAAWAEKVGHNRDRFKTALSQLLQKSKHVILITQPPGLPKYASREEIRKSGLRPIFEDITSSTLRQDTNTFLLSHRNERVHVLDIESLFKKSDGEIRFTNSQGRQLYHDGGHLSGYGSEMVKKLLVKEISQILALSPSTVSQSDSRG
jgi:hypothetical protein